MLTVRTPRPPRTRSDFLQPEESMSIQHAIGADIIMQLDDVGQSFSLTSLVVRL
jgi:tRNA-guanine family transglycosylase